jgi:outer membrane receptor protein involved in Fe transport
VEVLILCALFASDPDVTELPTETPPEASPDAPPSAPARDVEPSVFDILEEQEEVVQTGAGRAMALREVPGSVWVIDERTIRAMAATSLVDLLRMIPGVFTREFSYGQTEDNLRFPGSFPENQTLILIDGRSVLFFSVGTYDRNLPDIHDIERIELVFGPSSTLYGANAFSGVVNIITRKGNRKGVHSWIDARGGVATGAEATQPIADRVGGYGQGYGELHVGWGSGGLRLSAGASELPGFGVRGQSGLAVVTAPMDRASATVDVNQTAGAWELRAQGMAAYKRSPFVIIDASLIAEQDYALRLLATRRFFTDDTLTIDSWVRYFDFDARGTLPYTGTLNVPFKEMSAEARVQYALPTLWHNQITVGGQARGMWDFVAPVTQSGRALYLVGLYAEDNFRPIKQLIFTGGVRLDDRESPGDKAFRDLSVSPRVAAVWLVNDDHSLRAEYSSAFRTPTAIERAANISTTDGILVAQGTPSIVSERAHAWSLAYLGRFGWVKPRLEVFVARTYNNITPNLVPLASPATDFQGQPYGPGAFDGQKLPIYFKNIPVVPFIPGAVAKVDLQPHKDWRLFAQYSYGPAVLKHVAGAGVEWIGERVTVSAQAFYHDQVIEDVSDGSRPSNARAARLILNARVAVVLDNARRFTMSIAGLNLGDIRFFYGDQSGRKLFFSDDRSGEHVGMRLWAALEYRYD